MGLELGEDLGGEGLFGGLGGLLGGVGQGDREEQEVGFGEDVEG